MRRLYLIVALALFVVGGITAVNAQQSTTQGGTPSIACATPAASPGASPTPQTKLEIVASPNATANGSGNFVVLTECSTPVATAALP
jgi:hypothetical protein